MPFTKHEPPSWADTIWLATRSLFLIVLTVLSLLAVVVSSIVVGFCVGVQTQNLSYSVLVGIVSFFSGMSGRQYLIANVFQRLFSRVEIALAEVEEKK